MEPKTIFNFVIEKRIGAGGQGQVFKGYEKLKNYPVAIKLIGRWDDSDIEKEISILKELRHPNLVQLIGVEQTDDYHYIIMEYCEHGDLGKFIEKKFPEGKMPECQVQRLFQHVIRGLYAMHESNIVHRDLKPENILIGENFMPKICDFGVSKERRNSKTLKTTLGTSIYMAPEVIRADESGEFYDEKCDIWSLGIMLYKVLLGTFPYPVPKGYSFDPLLKAINETNPLENVQTLSEPLLDLLKSMLTVDYKKRIGYNELMCHRWVKGTNLYPSIKFEHPSFSLVEKKERVVTLNGDDSWVKEFSHEEKQRYYKRLQEKELIIDYRAQSQPIYEQNTVTVYHGFDCNKKREIAIKVKENSQPCTDMLSREYRILSKLDHPNIIKCFDSYKDSQGNVYLFYEWCSRGNLESFINKNFPKRLVPEHQAQKIAKQLFAAMKVLKEKALIHTNLQLRNILINDLSNLKLAGFSSVCEENDAKEISKSALSECKSTHVRIQQNFWLLRDYDWKTRKLEGKVLNDKCEIWFLGVILYQILTGKFSEIHLPSDSGFGSGDPLKPIKENPNLSDLLKNLLFSMLTNDAVKRSDYQTLFSNPWINGSYQAYHFGEAPKQKITYQQQMVANNTDILNPKSMKRVESSQSAVSKLKKDMPSVVQTPISFVILGPACVGKTSIIDKYTNGACKDYSPATIETDYGNKRAPLFDGSRVRVNIWDTAGQERFRLITKLYYHMGHGIIFVYDCCRRETLSELSSFVRDVNDKAKEGVSKILVGNKNDLPDERQVTYEEGKRFAEENSMAFFETSAKTGENIHEIFEVLIEEIRKTREINEVRGFRLSSQVQSFQYEKEQGGCRC